jgi:cytochrome c peroxidase
MLWPYFTLRSIFFSSCTLLFLILTAFNIKLKTTLNEKPLVLYLEQLDSLASTLEYLNHEIGATTVFDSFRCAQLTSKVHNSRLRLKRVDFWLRYIDPILYKHINGPLPIEWEVEVFEKYEPPYQRNAGGLILIEEMLDSEAPVKDSLLAWCSMAIEAVALFKGEERIKLFRKKYAFLFCNRLFLLNLSTIYNTGYECPDRSRIIPELRELCQSMDGYNRLVTQEEFPVSNEYHRLFSRLITFLAEETADADSFSHVQWLRDYVIPLYSYNALAIAQTGVSGYNFNDYSLQNSALSMLDPNLYLSQNKWGVLSASNTLEGMAILKDFGRMLYYDPLLSGNLQRSCASCHKPEFYFADTARFPLAYDGISRIKRNAPSLFLASSNHLLMADGAHFNLQEQAKGVIMHVEEMAGSEKQILERLNKVPSYKKHLKYFQGLKDVSLSNSFDIVLSALSAYYASFGDTLPNFFRLLRQKSASEPGIEEGFNLFMGKAQCATCHFFPRFNGVKPPYTGSEFEVIGTPEHGDFAALSADSGRYKVHRVAEMMFAFRTPGLWNVQHTAPYMHNGSLKTLEEVIDFYNAGGGTGKGFSIPNQTLPSDSLGLSASEKLALMRFLKSLSSDEPLPVKPIVLPKATGPALKRRQIAGKY